MVLALNPDFESYVARSFAFRPSTGFTGVMLALHTCRSVTVYGFGQADQKGEGAAAAALDWPRLTDRAVYPAR